MSEDEAALALGRKMMEMLKRSGDWPRHFKVELADHKRSLLINDLGDMAEHRVNLGREKSWF